MLCLKAEVLGDQDSNHHHNSNGKSGGGGGGGGGFVLPINFAIHKYLRRIGRVSTRSISSGDGSSPSSSISDFEDAMPQEKRSGQLKGGNTSTYKCQLEQDVKKLQQQLEEEITLRLALASAVEHSDSSLSMSPCDLPDKAQEVLESIARLEITVLKLEQELVTLQYQLSQERNERRLAEYQLRHLPCSESSMLDSSQAHFMEPVMGPGTGEEVEANMEYKPPWPDITKKPDKDHFAEKFWHHPNRLSEEMVLCMRDIFIFLSDSSKLSSSEFIASPSSPQGCHPSYSSLASFSDSPIVNSLTKNPLIDMEHGSEAFARCCKFDPYGVPSKVNWVESIGTYSTAVEVSWLAVGKTELEYASGALKRFRFLVEQLAKVNPTGLSCNEKLAFWINVYNALIMHAFLAYGVPRSDIKLFSIMQKAAYTVGGHSFSAADIEFIILKMKPPAHCPQIALILALQKFKVTEEQKKFSIDQPEPLLAFALSCGMYSSPAVRVFRPENVNELLKKSLKDYVQASVGISNKSRLLVPKLLYCFAKGIVDDLQLPEWICQFLTGEQASMVRDCSSNHKWRLLGARNFSVLPFDSRFRYLFLL